MTVVNREVEPAWDGDFGSAGRIQELPNTEQEVTTLLQEGPGWLVEYAEKQYLPLSVYDQHQETLVAAGTQALDDFIADKQQKWDAGKDEADPTKTDPDYYSHRNELEKATALRSHLVAAKVSFEMRRDRGDVATWLVEQVTEFSDKLRLFDDALSLENDAAHAVIMGLGDLRGEAEERGNLDQVAKYLMIEMEHGLGLFENSRAVDVLLADANLGRAGDYDYKRSMRSRLDKILYAQARTIIRNAAKSPQADSEAAAYASELVAISREASDKLKSYINCKRGIIDTAEPQVTKMPRKTRNVFNELQAEVMKHDHYSAQFVDILFRFPRFMTNKVAQRVSSQLNRLIVNDPHSKAKVDAQIDALSAMYPEIERPPVTLEMRQTAYEQKEAKYTSSLNRGISIVDDSGYGKPQIAHDANIVELFTMAAQLTLEDERGGIEKQDPIAKAEAALELVVQEMDADRSRVMTNDFVDQSRHRQKFNRDLAEVFGYANKIAFAWERLLFLEKLIDVQVLHDTSRDSSYTSEMSELRGVIGVCLTNPVAKLSIDKEEVLRIAEKFEVDWEKLAKAYNK